MPSTPRALAALLLLITCSTRASAAPAPAPNTSKTAPATRPAPTSAFYPPHVLARIRANADRTDWGRDLRVRAVAAAEPWRAMSADDLWRLVFGATIPRSWHVFSSGHCPACDKPVPMYDWKIDAIKQPWKVRCPHCQALFPKNDFAKFHASGLDEHGVFDPARADRALLFNTEHPGADDPKRTFGVDDGTGYVEGDKRWRFIGAYLVYGQWKQAVEGGIKSLATAYLLTGDPSYAHQAGVLLDRVADVYPTFDFKTQGILYESVRADGYVSVWHDATIETRELALAYDAVKDAIARDDDLATFLAAKSEQFKTPLPKRSPADVMANIEQRILRDALASPQKIYSNFPQRELTTAVIQTALGWPANREEVLKTLDPAIAQSVAVDGTTGEKGLANYTAYAGQRLAEFLGYYARADEKFLPEMIARHPKLPQMWRFFIDTWIAEKYYPTSGDTHWFAGPHPHYAGVTLSTDHGLGTGGHGDALLTPSMYTFLWQLYRATNDPTFAQVLHQQNGGKTDGLPYDLFHEDPAAMRRELDAVIAKHGAEINVPSINKQQWRLAVLRSGKGEHRRAVWLDYDSGGGHGHADGMNLGLVARGLDLMPDFGYPPVQFGGWDSPRANWYKSTYAHNTVLVDGANQPMATGDGTTTLWAAGAGAGVQAITASAPALNGGNKFERTVALIDVNERDAYVLDVFRVAGGSNHRKFFSSHFGAIVPDKKLAAATQPATDFAHPQMRDFSKAVKPAPGWSVDWHVEDRYKLLEPKQAGVKLRYTDFTTDADAYLGEAWVVAGSYNHAGPDTYVPRVMTQHQKPADAAGPLASTFVSLIEPFGPGESPIKSARRLALQPTSNANVALAIDLRDGRSDLLISTDAPGEISDADSRLRTDARFAALRRDANGKPLTITICQGRMLRAEGVSLELSQVADVLQLRLESDGAAVVTAGVVEAVRALKVDGQTVRVRGH